jgi:hypothetical protein
MPIGNFFIYAASCQLLRCFFKNTICLLFFKAGDLQVFLPRQTPAVLSEQRVSNFMVMAYTEGI